MERPDITFGRSETGIYNKYLEAINILEFSILLVEFFEKKEFNNVIAAQLRLILCDSNQGTDNSLINKIQDTPKLHPIVDTFVQLDDGESSFIAGELFDYNEDTILLDDWLDQIIYKIKIAGKLQKLSIKDFIKLTANKSGGAHVEKKLMEKAFIVAVHGDTVLCRIAKGLLRYLNIDLNESHQNIIKNILKKLELATLNP